MDNTTLNSDFTNAKVGDEVYSIKRGKGIIMAISTNNIYSVTVAFEKGVLSFTIDGRFHESNKFPELFTHPVKVVHADARVIEERVMEVSDNGKDWYTRVVFLEKNGIFYSWIDVKTIEKAKEIIGFCRWKYARPIDNRKLETEAKIADLQKQIDELIKSLEA